MAITFPASPTNGQTFTSGNKTWQWDGTTWLAYGASLSPSVLKVDATNSRVGINNQSPTNALDVNGTVAVTNDITRGGVSLPRGIMGAVYRTAGNVAFTVGSTTDITGMSVEFTAEASRTYKATWTVTGLKDTANGWCGAFLTNGTNTIFGSVYQTGFIVSGAGYVNLSGVTYFSNLAAGSQTLKLRQQTENSGGTILASGTNPCVLIIEDIGAA
jgi:hypothetical protein